MRVFVTGEVRDGAFFLLFLLRPTACAIGLRAWPCFALVFALLLPPKAPRACARVLLLLLLRAYARVLLLLLRSCARVLLLLLLLLLPFVVVDDEHRGAGEGGVVAAVLSGDGDGDGGLCNERASRCPRRQDGELFVAAAAAAVSYQYCCC